MEEEGEGLEVEREEVWLEDDAASSARAGVQGGLEARGEGEEEGGCDELSGGVRDGGDAGLGFGFGLLLFVQSGGEGG